MLMKAMPLKLAVLLLLSLLMAPGCPVNPPPVEDTTPPAAVTDLTAQPMDGSNGIVILSWTAVADDGAQGVPATSYDIRYDTAPITEESWSNATAFQQTLQPADPGTLSTLQVGNLTPAVRYYFAMVVLDDEGNTSSLSNVADVVAPGDVVPPGQVLDLAALPSAAFSGAADLSWTAVADDGYTGEAAVAYELRYSTAPIYPANWSSAQVYAQSWTPLSPGQAEAHRVYGLVPGTAYYFVLGVSDDQGNTSPLSNNGTMTLMSAWIWEQPAFTPETLRDLSFLSGGIGFGVGDQGTVLHYDGTTWRRMISGTSHSLYGVWALSSSCVFAVGQGGEALHYDGNAWTSIAAFTAMDLHAVWGASVSDVYALGYGGLFHYDGSGWAR